MKDKTLIMIVDDDPNIAQLVKLYLEKDGYDTVAYGRGDEALAAFLDTLLAAVMEDL